MRISDWSSDVCSSDLVAVEVGDDRAHGRAEPALEGHRQGLDEADLDAEAPAGGGHLCSDEARADHCDPTGPGLERGADGQAVVERAKGVNAVEVVGAGEAPGRGAGGDEIGRAHV